MLKNNKNLTEKYVRASIRKYLSIFYTFEYLRRIFDEKIN